MPTTQSPLRQKAKIWLKRLLFVFFSLLIGGLLMLTLFQSKLLYHPTQEHDAVPKQNHENIWMQSTNGRKIHGWWFPLQQAQITILLCHGNAGNISHRLFFVPMFQKRKAQFFLFDYQGFGKSEGTPSEQGTYDDAKAAWDFLTKTKQIPASQIVIFGRSLGSSIASQLASTVQAKGLILEAPFSSFHDVGKAHFPYLPVRWLARFHYPTALYLQKRSCPLLILHSTQDEVIPYSLGQTCYEQASSPKEFVTIQGSHNDGIFRSEALYFQKVDAFLASLSRTEEQKIQEKKK